MNGDIQLISVTRVFQASDGTYEFHIYRGTEFYWHVDVKKNGESIESYNTEINGDCIDYIVLCEEFFRCGLYTDLENKHLQSIRLHVINEGKKYNLILENINEKNDTFCAKLIDENDEEVNKKVFDLCNYEKHEKLFKDLLNVMNNK